MTAPTQRAGGLDANTRGILVLVAAVAIGLLLLWKAGGPGDATPVSSGAPSTTVDTSGLGEEGDGTTTTAGEGEVTSTTTAGDAGREPGEVTVLVLNGSGIGGAAAANSTAIGEKGYQMGQPSDANANIDATAVYYAEGFQAEATQVATVLGKEASVVAPMPDPVPGPGADAANVVVVLGADTSPPGGGDDAAATTTTTAG